MAALKSLEILNAGYTWILDIDLENFFDTVDHDILIQILAKTIKDKAVVEIIKKSLSSGVMIKGKLHRTTRGLFQGSPLSPLLSNVMLNELDQKLEARKLKFVRYGDDVLIFTKKDKASKRAMILVSRYLSDELSLFVNMRKVVWSAQWK